MKRTRNKAFPKSSIIAVAAASMALTACEYLGDLPSGHDPSGDNPIQISSSSKVVQSSSAVKPYAAFQTWYGSNGEEQIMTGFSTETETAGYWFEYDDSPDGGQSKIYWPVPKGNEYYIDSMDPIVLACNGICGTAALSKGSMTYNPFVGVGFNLAGETSVWDPTPAAADASSMGGVCITYSSEVQPTLQMSLGDEIDAQIYEALPMASLSKSTVPTTKFIPWSSFKQPSWYKGDFKISGEQAAKQLVSLKFVLQAAPGEYFFNISAIGPLDGCSETTPPVDPPTKPSTSNVFETWFGWEGYPQVITGYGNETETSGYWFNYNDSPDGGYSTIVWPVERGNDYDVDALDPVIEYCNGLCGKAVLSKGSLMYNPFVGVGFNLGGETSATDNTPIAVDASGMGGVCITYTSDIAPTLQMGFTDEVDASIGYANPYVSLPKSSTTNTTRFIPWSSFTQPSWYKGDTKLAGEQAAMQLVSLKFNMQGAPGEYNFNIKSIGPYNGGKCAGYDD